LKKIATQKTTINAGMEIKATEKMNKNFTARKQKIG
jgi:hypothetical protein